MPKAVHNVQFTMTNVQSVLLIGHSVVEFIEVFRSMTNCRICRRIVMEHWPNANEKRCSSKRRHMCDREHEWCSVVGRPQSTCHHKEALPVCFLLLAEQHASTTDQCQVGGIHNAQTRRHLARHVTAPHFRPKRASFVGVS